MFESQYQSYLQERLRFLLQLSAQSAQATYCMLQVLKAQRLPALHVLGHHLQILFQHLRYDSTD